MKNNGNSQTMNRSMEQCSWNDDEYDMQLCAGEKSPEELKYKKSKLGLQKPNSSFQTSNGDGRYKSGQKFTNTSLHNDYATGISSAISPKNHYRQTSSTSELGVRNERSRRPTGAVSPPMSVESSKSRAGQRITPGSSLLNIKGGKSTSSGSQNIPNTTNRISLTDRARAVPAVRNARQITQKKSQVSILAPNLSSENAILIKKRVVETQKQKAPEIICLDDDDDDDGDDFCLPLTEMYTRIQQKPKLPLGTLNYKEPQLGAGFSADLHMVFVGRKHFEYDNTKDNHCTLTISAGQFVLKVPDISSPLASIRTKKGKRNLDHIEHIDIDTISAIV